VPCNQILARMIFVVVYRSIRWVPVDMHIQWRHEDRYLSTFPLDVFVLLYFFDDHHLPIARSDYGFIINVVSPGGNAEELEKEIEEYKDCGCKQPKQPMGSK